MIEQDKTNLDKGKVRAVIYARFSSDMQREESIDAQVRACKYYAQKENIEVVKVYADRAKSGKRVKGRQEFLDMIEDSTKNFFDVVLVHKLNRFGRDGLDTLQYKKQLEQNNVALVSVTEKLDNSPEGRLMLMVIAGLNEFYSANLSCEVMKGLRENAYNGKHTGGIPPLGYDLDPTTKTLIINEWEAQAVRLIFDRYVNGAGYTKIIDELNAKGYKTKRGSNFGKNSLYEILRNEKYVGSMIYNRSVSQSASGTFNRHQYKDDSDIIRVENALPIIIEKDVFDRTQVKMHERKFTRGRYRAKEVYLLSGKVVCGECGSAYTGISRVERPDHPQYVSYRCSKRNGSVKCKNPEIKREILESFILHKLATYVFDESQIPLIAEVYRDYLSQHNKGAIIQKEALKKRLSENKRSLDNVVGMIMKTGSSTLADQLKILEDEKTQIECAYRDNEALLQSEMTDEKALKSAFKKAKKMLISGKLENKKMIIEQYVDKVLIYKDHIEVRFNFGLGENEKKKPQNVPRQSDNSTESSFAVSMQNIDTINGGEGGIRTLAALIEH